MNRFVHNWDMEEDFLPTSNQKKSLGPDYELVELLWRNGQVVLNSQTHRKQSPITNESVQSHKCDRLMPKDGGFLVNSSDFMEEDETASWIHYPLEDSMDREFCSNFLYELSNSHSIENDKPIKHVEGEKYEKFGVSDESTVRSQQPDNVNLTSNLTEQRDPNLSGIDRIENFPHFSRLIKTELGSSSRHNTKGKGSSSVIRGEFGESSVKTVGSSHCGSNQLPNEAGFSQVSSNNQGAAGIVVRLNKVSPQNERGQMVILEPTITSSSGGSGGNFTGTQKQSMNIHGQKRKGRDADESESQSEDAEFGSAEANKPPHRSGSARRTRAAEVHNLSERRRRDRINEKMKALQELIPHCNKSDKASMLDEAIEYLKSLQLQVQMMWMGSGMAPMMFPGKQHYIPRMGVGVAHPPLPSIHNQMQIPRIPLVEQAMCSAPTPTQPAMCSPQVLNAVNFQNPIPSANFPEQYARFMGFHHMQTSQPMNIFSYGSQTAHQNIGRPSSSSGPCHGGCFH